MRFTSSQAKFSDIDEDYFSVQESISSTTFESKINDETSFDSSINIPSINPSDSFGIDDTIDDQDSDMPF